MADHVPQEGEHLRHVLAIKVLEPGGDNARLHVEEVVSHHLTVGRNGMVGEPAHLLRDGVQFVEGNAGVHAVHGAQGHDQVLHGDVARSLSDARDRGVHRLHAVHQGDDGVGHAEAEVHMEVGLQGFLDALLGTTHEVLHGLGREDSEGVHQDQGIHVALCGDALDEIEVPGHLRTGGVDGEEDGVKACLLGRQGSVDGGLYGPLQGPLVGQLNGMLRGGHLHDDPFDPGVGGPFHIFGHAPGEGKYLGIQPHLGDDLDGFGIGGGDGGHAGLYALHSRFAEHGGDADLVILGEYHSGLLLAISEGDVVDLHSTGEVPPFGHLREEVPRAHEPVVAFPGLLHCSSPW